MTGRWHVLSLAAASLMLGVGGVRLAAATTDSGATIEADALGCSDVHLEDAGLLADEATAHTEVELSATQTRIGIDYAPAPADFVSQPVYREENSTSAGLTGRLDTDSDLSPLVTVGGYRGFTDYRSVWLDEFYRQLFSIVPGYVPVTPMGGMSWQAGGGPTCRGLPSSNARSLSRATPYPRGMSRRSGFRFSAASNTCARPPSGSRPRTCFRPGFGRSRGRGNLHHRPGDPLTVQGSVNWAVSETLTLRWWPPTSRKGTNFIRFRLDEP